MIQPVRWTPVLAVCACVLLRCGFGPGVEITIPDATCTLYGTVSPKGIAARVCVVGAGDTVGLDTADPTTGEFTIRALPYGTYAVVACSGDLGGRQPSVVLDRPFVTTSVNIQVGGMLISSISYPNGDTITPDRLSDDLWLSVNIYPQNWVQLGETEPVEVLEPSWLNRSTTFTVGTTGENGALRFNGDSLFSVDSMSILIRVVVQESGLPPRPDSVVYSYVIDSAGFDSVATSRLVRSVDANLGSTAISGISREGPVYVEFRRDMDRQSVEDRVTATEGFEPTFLWASGTSLRIYPARGLPASTSYTLTIGAGAATLDSARFRTDFTIRTWTTNAAYFTDYWPRWGSIDVPLEASFSFSSPYSLDPVLLGDAFSIDPSVDSLVFTSPRSGVVEIRHAALLPDTLYRITIDPSCQTRMGTVLGDTLAISFRTQGTEN